MPRVVHFEFAVDNPERAKKFYKGVFGWKIEKWNGPMEYWLVTTGDKAKEGIDGGFGKRTSPQDTTVNTIDVPDVDKYIRLVEKNGGSIVQAKHAIPGVGWLAYFKDPEGNMWGVLQEDPSAK